MSKDKIREAAEYVLNPPTVPCNPPHPGFKTQYESQSTLVVKAQIVAQAWLDQNIGESSFKQFGKQPNVFPHPDDLTNKELQNQFQITDDMES